MANEVRLIDANALMDVIRQHDYPLATRLGSIDNGMFTLGIQQAVDEQPTVDAVPVVHGRWIEERCNHKPHRIKNPEKWVIRKCSICGYSNGRKVSNYCPNCGAKMDGDGNGTAKD